MSVQPGDEDGDGDRSKMSECESKRQRRGFKSLNNFYVSHYSERQLHELHPDPAVVSPV